jgi:hypothetical protein
MEVLCSMWNGTPMQLCSLYLCFMKKHHTFVSERPGHGEFGKKSKRNKVLKSELGGLMNNLNLFPFMRRGILGQNTDFNNITESGIYTYTSLASFTNSPDNDYGILLVFNGSGYLIQEAIQVVNNLIIKYRSGVVVDGKFQWHDWKQIETK